MRPVFFRGCYRSVGGCGSPCCPMQEPHIHVADPCGTGGSPRLCVSAGAIGGWTDDARRAMTDNPEYFVWWYTAKSLAAVGAIAAAAYFAGKDAGRRSLRANRRRRRR